MKTQRNNLLFLSKYIVSIVLLINISIANVFAQNNVTKGLVLDSSGMPLIGATVVLQGNSTIGTITDMDGKFVLNADKGNLEVSYVGYVTKTVAITAGEMKIVLTEDSETLEEVVVVGYGKQKKSDVTGSIVSFDVKALSERPQTQLLQALQGVIPGLSVTSSSSSAEENASLLIRGKNSITADNSPLVIVDGVPSSMDMVNPNDVQSLEVLKDASSTAIYGSRGANGVILVTTKKGSSGKIKISYDGYYSWDQVAHLPDMENAADYWNHMWERNITNSLMQPTSVQTVRKRIEEIFKGDDTDNTYLQAFMQGYPGKTWNDFSSEIFSKYPEHVHDYATLQQIANDFAYPANGRNTDWIDLVTRTGHKHNQSLSLSGGNEKIKFFVSGNFTDNKGIAKGDDYQRMSFRANIDFELFKGVHYGTNTQLLFTDTSGTSASWGGEQGAFLQSPLYNAYNEDGSLDIYPADELPSVTNPLEALLYKDVDKKTTIITNHYFDIDIPKIEGLHYKLNFGFDSSSAYNKNYKGRNTSVGAKQDGILSLKDSFSKNWLLENILSYNRQFGVHDIFLTALYSAQEAWAESNSINGHGFENDVMGYYQASKAEVLTASSSHTKSRHISQMFRANYGYDNRYLFTATIRRDGYSAFGKSTKFGLFPSIALGWNIMNEKFMKDFTKVNNLKLRLSYGKNGNEAIKPFATLPGMSSLNYINWEGKQLFGYYPSTLGNDVLGWETTKSYNVGLDFGFLNNRITGSIDAYQSWTSDLLLNESISPLNGTTQILRNIGKTKNKGVEFQISSVNINSKDFYWKTDFNVSRYKSVISNVGLKDAEGNYIDDVASEWFIGHPVDVYFDYKLDRVLQKSDFITDDAGNYVLDENNAYQLKEEVLNDGIVLFGSPYPGQALIKDIDGDGRIGGSEDKEIIGNTTPECMAGMVNTFKYKNFTLSFFLNGVFGVTKRSDLHNPGNSAFRRKLNVEYWTPDNATNDIYGINYGSPYKPLYYYDKVNYVRLQDITFSYDLPSKFLSKIAFSDATVYLNIKNLHTFTNWIGLDPEYDSQNNIPRVRSFVLGLRFSL